MADNPWDVNSWLFDTASGPGSSRELIQPSPKRASSAPLPRPACFDRDRPRFASPFQVRSTTLTSQLSETAHRSSRHSAVGAPISELPVGGLPPPMHSFGVHSHADQFDVSLSAPGLGPPCILRDTPLSLKEPMSSASPVVMSHSVNPHKPLPAVAPELRRGFKRDARTLHSFQDPINLGRVRITASSRVVWTLWEQVAPAVHRVSGFISVIDSSAHSVEHLSRLFNRFAATTLVKYFSAVLQFLTLCSSMHIAFETLNVIELADMLVTCNLAQKSDGSGPAHSTTLKALRWMHRRLDIRTLEICFHPVIHSFMTQKLPANRRDALPHSLFVLCQWDRRVLQQAASTQEIVILGGFILLLFSGLRFGDIQRCHLSTWMLDDSSLRGLTWRAKTCSTSTPWGVVISGFLSKGSWTWVHRYLQCLDHLYSSLDQEAIDFVFPSFTEDGNLVWPPQAMTHGEAYYFLRKYLHLPWKQTPLQLSDQFRSYTIHGLKATLISWAAQCEISEEYRRLHGKRKGGLTSTGLYSRDDVLGSLKLQSQLVRRVQEGLEEPPFQLEQYAKELPFLTWSFFRFNRPVLEIFELPSDSPPEQVESSSSSSSSQSDSSDSLAKTDIMLTRRVQERHFERWSMAM